MYLASSPMVIRGKIEEKDKSEILSLATWVVLGFIVSVFIARQAMKAFMFRKIFVDDFLIFAATVFAIALSVTTSLLASRGHESSEPLTTLQINILNNYLYPSNLFYILSLCFSKLSLLSLFSTVLVLQRIHRRVILGFATFIVLWTVASAIAVTLQCRLPKPWGMMTLRCLSMRVFWIAYCVIDIFTEVAIIMLSFHLVNHLRWGSLRKFAVVSCFAARVFVIAASLTRLIWLYPVIPENNPGYQLWLLPILSQVHVCLSICTECIPFLVPVFRNLDDNRHAEVRKYGGHGHTQPSLWFRRQRKSKALGSWDYGAVDGMQYERVPQPSPQLPSPQPLSPFTLPQLKSRPETVDPGSTNRHGLSISIPARNSGVLRTRTGDVRSPQTASSFTLSPSSTPVLSMHSSVSIKDHPTPPPEIYSSKPAIVSSWYSSRSSSPKSPAPRPARFSLFPEPVTPRNRPSPGLRQSGFMPSHMSPSRPLRPSEASGPSRHTFIHNSHASVDQSRNIEPHVATRSPNCSAIPHPESPSSTRNSPTPRHKHLSVQELNSPMGAAINQYFRSATPAVEPPPPALMPIATPRSAYRQHDHRVLPKTKTLRTQKPLPRSPLPGT